MVKLRRIYHLLFLLGVHQDIILGTQMIIFYLVILFKLVILVSLMQSNSTLGDRSFTCASPRPAPMLSHSMSDAPSLLMFLK